MNNNFSLLKFRFTVWSVRRSRRSRMCPISFKTALQLHRRESFTTRFTKTIPRLPDKKTRRLNTAPILSPAIRAHSRHAKVARKKFPKVPSNVGVARGTGVSDGKGVRGGVFAIRR